MAEPKRKISVRKILQTVLTFVAAVGCIIAMVSASDLEGEKTLKKLPVIQIKNDRKYHSVEQKKIMDLAIYNRNIDILNTPVSRLDVRGIERSIMSDPWVADVQVFIDIDRVMHINVTRRVPVARIFRQDGASYYMDSTLHTMPLSDDYTYYTTVVTNAPVIENDSAGLSLKTQIARLVKTIHTDSFWSAQVSQVVIDSAGMFELMPVIGNQRILLGDTSRLDEKLSNLLSFYKNVLNRIGWDKYECLDVRFKGQVVASPSLPYHGPRDMAINKMNWITSIETTEAQKMHEDSVRAEEARIASMAAAKASSMERARKKAEAAAKIAAEKKAAEKAAHKQALKTGAKPALQKKPGMSGAPRSKQTGKATKAPEKAKPAVPAGGKKQQKHDPKDVKKQMVKAAEKSDNKGHAVAPKDAKTLAKEKSAKTAKPLTHPAAKSNAKKVPATVKGHTPVKGNKKEDNKKKGKSETGKQKKDSKKTKDAAAKYTYPENKKH